ncbi:hypothetical protein OG21DRAFT_623959 [Imleria badia]|nr:hypothetical protein OG21DRAFT_623959 [Imleria badia]
MVWVGEDNHIFEAQKCPWLSLHPLVLYEDFALQVQDSMRQSYSGDKELGLAICARRGQLRDGAEPHSRCLYGSTLFMIAFMIWTARPIRDHVFSLLSLCSSISIPSFGSRSKYAEWLRFHITSGSSLRYIHLIVVAYRLLRNNDLLPWYVSFVKYVNLIVSFSTPASSLLK